MKLTLRQQQVLTYIRHHIELTGYPPTRAEISRELGFKSPNAAEDHLKALHRKGVIEIIQHTSRGIRLPEEGHVTHLPEPFSPEEELGLPLVGSVAAGSPILAVEHVEAYCAIPADFFKPPANYLLRVKGMSMKNIGIMDGDLLAVHQTQHIKNGQVVVARLDDEVTVKRFQRKGNKVSLIAENEEYNPIEVDLTQQDFTIEGLAVGVIRQGRI